jgi:branched-chain amino acid transport system permease protein
MVRYFRHPMFITFAVFLILPAFIMRLGGMSLAIEVMIWVIFAMGFNILLGYTGLPSFGHGLFFGTGAYICGLIQQHIIAGTWIPILGSMLFCGIIAGIMGLFLARKRGIYFALLTVALTQLFFFIAFLWDGVTGGENGLMGIERYPLTFFGLFSIPIEGILPYYYFVFVIFMVSLILLWKIVHSPLGSVLYATKQN